MMRERIIIVILMLFTVLAFAACTKPDHSDEAEALSDEIFNEGIADIEHSLERVDSAEEAGVFTAVRQYSSGTWK